MLYTSVYLNFITVFQVENGSVFLTLNVDEVITLTTLNKGFKGQHPDPPQEEPFPLPFKENFDGKNNKLNCSFFYIVNS